MGSESVSHNLTPKRLAHLLRGVNEGDADRYLTLAEEMEENDLHYRSVLFTRRMMLSSAPRMVTAAGDSEEHRRNKEVVEALVVEDAFTDLVFEMTDGLSKGYSVIETLWDTDHPGATPWRPVRYQWRDPRRFMVNPISGGNLRLRSSGAMEGKELPAGRYVVHRPRLKSGKALRSGLAYPAAIAYALKNFTVRDLMRFLEVMGIPARIAKSDEAMKDRKERRKLLMALRRLQSDTVAVVPPGTEIEYARGAGQGGDIFLGTARYWDAQISKLVLGQTMTTDDGASKSQAGVHNLVRIDIAQHDAGAVSADINRCLVRPFIDHNFGRPADGLYPRVSLPIREKENVTARIKAFCALADRGVEISQDDAREAIGVPKPEANADLMQPLSVLQLTDKDQGGKGDDDKDDPPKDDASADE